MSVSPDGFGQHPWRAADFSDDVEPSPRSQPHRAALPRRRTAGRLTVVIALGGSLLLVAGGAAAGVRALAPVRSAALALVDVVRPAPAAPVRSSVTALLDLAEARLDAGRLDAAAKVLRQALVGLEQVPPAERDATEVARYAALRTRLLGAANPPSFGPRVPSRGPGKPPGQVKDPTSTKRPSPADRPKLKSSKRSGDQPSSEASAKPRA